MKNGWLNWAALWLKWARRNFSRIFCGGRIWGVRAPKLPHNMPMWTGYLPHKGRCEHCSGSKAMSKPRMALLGRLNWAAVWLDWAEQSEVCSNENQSMIQLQLSILLSVSQSYCLPATYGKRKLRHFAQLRPWGLCEKKVAFAQLSHAQKFSISIYIFWVLFSANHVRSHCFVVWGPLLNSESFAKKNFFLTPRIFLEINFKVQIRIFWLNWATRLILKEKKSKYGYFES